VGLGRAAADGPRLGRASGRAASTCTRRRRRAVERALASVAAADEAGVPVEAARSRTLAARRSPRPASAIARVGELQRAAASSMPAGAALTATRRNASSASSATASTVARAGHADGTGLESLTERELQVARLVVERKTNPEIAAELFLSQKTVETHLRNIFRKMGVSSRVELARAVERADRAGVPL
jgi:DNA-binding NarL/FixJ family response regulator